MRTVGFMLVLAIAPALAAQEQAAAPKKQDQDKDKKEAQPKAAPKKPVPSYTDEDLKKARESGRGNIVILTDPAGNASATPSGSADAGKPAGEDRKFWQVQAAQYRQAITNAENAVRSIEARIGELTSDIAPNPGDLMDPSRLQKREAEKQQQLKALEAAKANLEATRKALTDFEEQARQQGIPAHWLQP